MPCLQPIQLLQNTAHKKEMNHRKFARSSFLILSHPIRDGGDDGDGVLDTAVPIGITVTTVTHRHAARVFLQTDSSARMCADVFIVGLVLI